MIFDHAARFAAAEAANMATISAQNAIYLGAQIASPTMEAARAQSESLPVEYREPRRPERAEVSTHQEETDWTDYGATARRERDETKTNVSKGPRRVSGANGRRASGKVRQSASPKKRKAGREVRPKKGKAKKPSTRRK